MTSQGSFGLVGNQGEARRQSSRNQRRRRRGLRARRMLLEPLEERQLLSFFAETEPNDTRGTADAITVPTGDILTTATDDWLTISASIADVLDADVFTFTLAAASGVFFDIDSRDVGLSNFLDTQLTLYDTVGGPAIDNNNDGYDFEGFGQPAASTADGTSRDSSLYRDLAAGTYWVQLGGFGGTTGDYYLRILADTNYPGAVPVFNSNAGATDTLYLDFDGHASNTDTWVVQNGNTPYTAAAFDLDGNAAQFSPGERLAMRNIWRAVSEDYSPFNINVTTVDPGGLADGVAFQQVVTNSDGPIVGQAAGIYGVAFVGSYNFGGVNTAFTFAPNFGDYSGGVSGDIMAAGLEQGNTSAHEFGHALTLDHFNTAPAGVGDVIPNGIMATPDQGFNREVWSNGTNVSGGAQDDLNIVGNVAINAIGLRADDHGDTTGTATAMTYDAALKRHSAAGIIERLNTDVDFFRFQVFASPGLIQIRADVDEYINDLDVELRVFDSGGTLLGTADPGDSFDAELDLNLAPGTYFAEVRSDRENGEIGQYAITVDEEDRFEENDTLATATVLGSEQKITLRDLSIHDVADVDYFQITAQDTGKLIINMFFPHADGNLDMQVRDGHDNVIASSLSVTDNEQVVMPVVSQERYFLKVFGAAGNTNVYDLEIENFPAPIPTGGFLDPASDTGRSNADNFTRNKQPQMFVQVDILNFVDTNHNDTRDAGEITALTGAQASGGITPGAAVQVWLTNTGTRTTVKAYANPLDPNNPVFYSFTPAAALPDGTYVVTAATWIFDNQRDATNNPSPASGRTPLSAPLFQFTVDTLGPSVSILGVDPASSDTGVPGSPGTFVDRITSDTATGFIGRAEADAVVRLYVNASANTTIDTPADFSLTVAVPLDGNQQFPNGQWSASFIRDLNGTPFPRDGLRTVLVEAEDVAGNINRVDDQVGDANQRLQIFIDTQGPRVWDPDGAGGVDAVHITEDSTTARLESEYRLFDPKPSIDGPTPLINSLTVHIEDLPDRAANFLYAALHTATATVNQATGQLVNSGTADLEPGHFLVRGDHNGIIPIESVRFISDVVTSGDPATGVIVIDFFDPLPDDRFTLTVSDALVDPAGNNLDGESNAIEPQEPPQFPSGDGVPGGDFVARFTVDSRAEIGVWGAGSVWLDTNGNFLFDTQNLDYTNRDLVYTLGLTSDDVFAGNFLDPGPNEIPYDGDDGPADGFDKLAAYGRVAGIFRWLIDTDNDGVPNLAPRALNAAGAAPDTATFANGLPAAGNFDTAKAGHELAVFNGDTWSFYGLDGVLLSRARPTNATGQPMAGYPVVGDFDADGIDDLGTWTDDVFQIALGVDNGTAIPAYPAVNYAFYFGFIGVRERPVAADMNGDGMDDLGLWVPDRTGATPSETGEWYILVSGGDRFTTGGGVGADGAPDTVLDRIGPARNPADTKYLPTVAFTPIPLGPDIYALFGDQYALPLVGNFDPPVAGGESPVGEAPLLIVGHTNALNPLDVNGDGAVSAADALLVINNLNAYGPRHLFGSTDRPPFLDASYDGFVSAIDALLVIDFLNSQSSGAQAQLGAQRSVSFAAEGEAAGPSSGVSSSSSSASTINSAQPLYSTAPASQRSSPQSLVADTQAANSQSDLDAVLEIIGPDVNAQRKETVEDLFFCRFLS